MNNITDQIKELSPKELWELYSQSQQEEGSYCDKKRPAIRKKYNNNFKEYFNSLEYRETTSLMFYLQEHGFICLDEDIPEEWQISNRCKELAKNFEGKHLQGLSDKYEGCELLIHDFRHFISRILTRVVSLEGLVNTLKNEPK